MHRLSHKRSHCSLCADRLSHRRSHQSFISLNWRIILFPFLSFPVEIRILTFFFIKTTNFMCVWCVFSVYFSFILSLFTLPWKLWVKVKVCLSVWVLSKLQSRLRNPGFCNPVPSLIRTNAWEHIFPLFICILNPDFCFRIRTPILGTKHHFTEDLLFSNPDISHRLSINLRDATNEI